MEDFGIIRFSNSGTVGTSFVSSLLVTLVSSHFHLMLVTFERLMAITFTMRYSNITDKNMKIAVLEVWISYLKSSFINWMVYLDPTY